MFNRILHQYVLDQLHSFNTSTRCCQQYCGSFRSPERLIFTECAVQLGFHVRPYISNGVQTIKVYKKSCLHFLEVPMHLRLEAQSKKDLYLLQCRSDFVGSHCEIKMSPEFFSPGGVRPSVPPHRFSLGLKQSMARQNALCQQNFQKTCVLQPYKLRILEAVHRNRVLVVNGNTSFDKSNGLPMYIIENCAECRSHCKIVCVERYQLLAIYNSEKLAEYFGEKIGNTVAYQVHLQSRISDCSNLIYTTASFLLRVLMGQSTIDSFRHISHVIVGDVQMHEAFADILLCELRTALRCHEHLKVILLSNSRHNSEFITYFGEGEVLQLDMDNTQKHKVLRIEDIRKLITKEQSSRQVPLVYANPPTIFRDISTNCEQLDYCLETYENFGTDQYFEAFLYMVHGEYASVNYRHSVSGNTALIIAAKLGKSNHLRILLELHADPFIMDEQNLNAVSNAISGGNAECVDLLQNFCENNHATTDVNPAFFDYTLITDIIRLLTTSCEWEPGNILVFAPSYEHLIRLNFFIARHKLIGDIPELVCIYILHSNIEKDQLDAVINMSENCINIILATDIACNIPLLHSIAYVIDSARIRHMIYTSKICSKEIVFEWASKEVLENRIALLNRTTDKPCTCFQLIPKPLIGTLSEIHTPELLQMPLDRICLTVKLLSQHTMVAEYLQTIIVRPPFLHIHHTAEYLKKIDVFDEFEDVTWLGCRLIDVPIDCQLGKLLVFAILLQCLDPVLTIVSFLSTSDPLELPGEESGLQQPYIAIIRKRIKQERKRLAENVFSDHLIYLRLYQEWQNTLRDDSPEMALLDEHHFVLNGILEKVCHMRTHLVGALRSSQLIHNQGQLSMHYINLKSNSWSMIKAALVAGLYPQICALDPWVNRIKSTRTRELVLHPSSILRNLEMESLNTFIQKFPSPWIVYGNESNSVSCNSISCCTLVAPLAVAMFAGPTKLHRTNITTQNDICSPSIISSCQSSNMNTSHFYLDEWIWFTMESSDAQLILKTRQYFYCTYVNFLQNCSSVDKWRRANISLTQIPRLFDTIEKVLMHEDMTYGLSQPDNVGLRPKAVPNKFITSFNSAISWDQNPNSVDSYLNSDILYTRKFLRGNMKLTRTEKQYFMVYLSESTDICFRKYTHEWLHDSVGKVVVPYISPEKMTFVIMYIKNPDHFCSIALAKKSFNVFKLQECFKNKVPIWELKNICSKHNLYIPSMNEKRGAFQIDHKIGNIILDLFAFRNNWLHNN